MAIQMLTLGPNLALLDSVRGLIQMGCRAILALRVIPTSTLTRFRIMPKPISTTPLVLREILNVHPFELSCFLSLSFASLAV